VKSEIDEVKFPVHAKSDDKHRVEPLRAARVGAHRVWQSEAQAVARGTDVETLASDRQVHLTSYFSWQLYTHHHILTARRTGSLASHLQQQRLLLVFYTDCTKGMHVWIGHLCPSVCPHISVPKLLVWI
jgi:hypothetical protein